jgi:hypothetical protein
MKLLQTGRSFLTIVSVIAILHVEAEINLDFLFFVRNLSAVWYCDLDVKQS